MDPILITKTYHKNAMLIGDVEFTYNDIKAGRIDPKLFGLTSDWYGGRVEYFGKTLDGFLLCVENGTKDIIGIYIPSLVDLSQRAINLLVENGIIDESNAPIVDKSYIVENSTDTNESDTIENSEYILQEIQNKVNERVARRRTRT